MSILVYLVAKPWYITCLEVPWRCFGIIYNWGPRHLGLLLGQCHMTIFKQVKSDCWSHIELFRYHTWSIACWAQYSVVWMMCWLMNAQSFCINTTNHSHTIVVQDIENPTKASIFPLHYLCFRCQEAYSIRCFWHATADWACFCWPWLGPINQYICWSGGFNYYQQR